MLVIHKSTFYVKSKYYTYESKIEIFGAGMIDSDKLRTTALLNRSDNLYISKSCVHSTASKILYVIKIISHPVLRFTHVSFSFCLDSFIVRESAQKVRRT